MFQSFKPLLLLLLLAPLLIGCGTAPQPSVTQPANPLEDLDYPVGSFALTERDGRTVTDKDLLGHVWIASFVFTRCMGNCPAVTAGVRELQSKIDDPNVRFVTFTVDAAHDTPGELKKYADRYQADPKRWYFLTGDEKTIRKLLQERFKQSAGDVPQPGHNPLDALASHSTRLAVVDKKGIIRAVYEGMRNPNFPDADERYQDNLKRLQAKVKQLLAE
jgi:cytochrome oxidase Cu insertion factor (SCO1/SenC/PrrC family)